MRTWLARLLGIRSPEGVRVVGADGDVYPCELTYEGRSESGVAHWRAVPPPGVRPVEGLIGMLPAKTAVLFDL